MVRQSLVQSVAASRTTKSCIVEVARHFMSSTPAGAQTELKLNERQMHFLFILLSSFHITAVATFFLIQVARAFKKSPDVQTVFIPGELFFFVMWIMPATAGSTAGFVLGEPLPPSFSTPACAAVCTQRPAAPLLCMTNPTGSETACSPRLHLTQFCCY